MICIRSQDRRKLVRVIGVLISECDGIEIHGYDNSSTGNDDYWYLGKYSSTEKAFKVLDMIQQKICRIKELEMLSNLEERRPAFHIHYKARDFMFEMPQDNEVRE